MSKVTATGIESALVLNWDGWDGDHEWMVFYNCELQPELWTKLTDEHAGLQNRAVGVRVSWGLPI